MQTTLTIKKMEMSQSRVLKVTFEPSKVLWSDRPIEHYYVEDGMRRLFDAFMPGVRKDHVVGGKVVAEVEYRKDPRRWGGADYYLTIVRHCRSGERDDGLSFERWLSMVLKEVQKNV